MSKDLLPIDTTTCLRTSMQYTTTWKESSNYLHFKC
ncbi:hypothetical protein FSU_2512 [Fibrobacter succinogenes subsp. succinogenes S85]|uniref:Uncharacterized protein n=1 Tax=Fibrobacter succinogenes (strain ATCC 19169 / S85) TaxID=59374 RepID=D9S5E8_FIBSS|nr:hypothetical protein FSU_2512 [Fibrobacter succinogenes subsp. succinogenes S85]